MHLGSRKMLAPRGRHGLDLVARGHPPYSPAKWLTPQPPLTAKMPAGLVAIDFPCGRGILGSGACACLSGCKNPEN
jgi:hypothetical protein